MHRILRFALFSPILGILFYLLGFYAQKGELPKLQVELTGFLTSAGFSLLSGFLTLGLCQYLNKVKPWEKNYSSRFGLQIILLTLIGLFILAVYIETFLLNGNSELSYTQIWLIHQENILKVLIILVLLVICYTLLDFMFYSYAHFRKEELKSMEMVNTQLQLQFDALKSQLSPHFLFNSLNTISSLLFKNPQMAEKFIRRFAETYRFILEQNENALIPLEKELNFVRDYNFILAVRFEKAFELDIDVPKSISQSQVPPMSVQMLVENAVKHNLVSRTSPLKLQINSSDNRILVKNNVNPLPNQPESFHIGIENIKRRYAYFTTQEIEIKKNDHFIVSLPIIP